MLIVYSLKLIKTLAWLSGQFLLAAFEILLKTMEICRVEDLELIIGEIKCSNEEAIRLFEDETRNSPMIGQSSLIHNSNSRRESLSLIGHHLQKMGCKLEEIDVEILKWNLLKELLESTTSENVAIKNCYLEEKRRTSSLYCSLNDAMSSQQTLEVQMQDLKSKYKALKKEERNTTVAYQKLNEKCQGLIAGKKRTKEENTTIIKKQKVASSSSAIFDDALTLDQSNRSIQYPPGDIPRHDLLTAPNGDGQATVFPSTSSSSLVSSSSTDKIVTVSAYQKDQGNNQQKQEKKIVSKKVPLEAGNNALIGREIKKQFKGHGFFTGRVTRYKAPYYIVCYDDGDKEELDELEVQKWLAP